jgi:hypothetical protein
MPVWLSRLLQDWRVLATDAWSLVIAVTLAVLIGAAALYWTLTSAVSSSSEFFREAVKELGELQVGYKALKKEVRDPNGLYRDGKRIGGVVKPDIDVPNGAVAFQMVSIDGELDRVTQFEFQDLILNYRGCDASDGLRQGDAAKFTYYRARFSIVGKRVD